MTIQQKNLLVLSLLVVLSMLSYHRSIKNTIANHFVLENNKQQLQKISASSNNSKALEIKLEELDTYVGKFKSAEHSQHEILNEVSKHPEIRIAKIESIHVAEKNNFRIYTHIVILSGPYNALSSVVYQLEKETIYSKITSIEYQVSKKSSKTKQLFATITFQSYEKILF